jgi:polar amino acid transport system substrate-binding protein
MEVIMKNLGQFILICCVAAVVSGVGVSRSSPAAAPVQQSVFDRIMQTHEIRCGYVNYPPLLIKDPNTGKFSGIGVDIMERVAQILNVKLVWAEETSWANYIEDLRNNRFDILCNTDFFLPAYAGRVDITSPLFYTGIGVYKRADDPRFAKGSTDFNNSGVTISAIDGSIAMMIKDADYPKAKLLSMPAMTDYSTILMNLMAKKADVTFVERVVANNFLKNNPGQFVNLTENKPLRVFPYFIPFKLGETKLQSTMNGIIQLMQENGEIDRILTKYENGTPSFYRVAKHYQ